jgi:RNA polymerase sigma factor (sigma-70 family)
MMSNASRQLSTEGAPPPPATLTYAAHAPLIERIIAGTCRQHRLSADEGEEFASWARERLLDGRVLGKFKGRCRLQTFLVVVVRRLFLDYRNARWGKYRPSAEAKRLGATALLLERLIVRDGYTINEAEEILRTNYQLELTSNELDSLVTKLPVRKSRRTLGEDALAELATSESAESEVTRREQHALRARVHRALKEVIQSQEPRDQLLLRMRFEEGMTIASIARTLRLEDKRLYRQLESLLRTLRTHLIEQGVTQDDAAAILGGLSGEGNV